MNAIKSLNLKLKDLSQTKKVIFLAAINLILLIIYQLDFSPMPIPTQDNLNYANIISVNAKLKVHPLFRGPIELIDEVSQKSLGQYNLINIEDTEEFDSKKVYLESTTRDINLNVLVKKSLLITPVGISRKIHSIRSRYDQSF